MLRPGTDDRRTSEISSDRFGLSTTDQPRAPPRQRQRWRQSQSTFIDQINAYLNRNGSSTETDEIVISKCEHNNDIYACDVVNIDDVERITTVSYFTDNHVTTSDNVHHHHHHLIDQNRPQENFTAHPENVAVLANHNDDHTTTTITTPATTTTIAKHQIVEREKFAPKTNDHPRSIHGDDNNDLLGYSASSSTTTSTSLKLENRRNCSSNNHHHHHHYRLDRGTSDHCACPNHSDSFVWCNHHHQPLPSPIITSTVLADETETVDDSNLQQPGCTLLDGLSGRILTTTTTATTTTALLNDNSDFHSDSSKLNDKNKPTVSAVEAATTIISVENQEEKEKNNRKLTETSGNNHGTVTIDDNIVLIKLNANGKEADVFIDDDDDDAEPTKKAVKPFFLDDNCTTNDNDDSGQPVLRNDKPKYFNDFKATTPTSVSTLLNGDNSLDKIKKGYPNSDGVVAESDALDEILSVEIPSKQQQRSEPISIINDNNDKNHPKNHDLKKEFFTLLSIQLGGDHHVNHNNNNNNNNSNNNTNRCESKCWHSIQSSSSSSSTPTLISTTTAATALVAKSNTNTQSCLSDANTKKIYDNSGNNHSHQDRPDEQSNKSNNTDNSDQISANQSTKRDTKLLPSSLSSTSCDQFSSCRRCCLQYKVSSTSLPLSSSSHIALPFGQHRPETITTTKTLDENINNQINEFVHYRSTKIDVGVLDVEKSCSSSSSFITDYSQTTTAEAPAASIKIGHNFEARIDDHSCYVEHHSKQQMKIMVHPKGILILSKQNDACPNETKTKFEKNNNNNHGNQSHNDGSRIYRKKPKKNIKFADGDAEIIGYRFSSDDEDDDDLELETETILSGQSATTVAAAAAAKAVSNLDPLDSFDLDDDENDLERLELKKLTESNTLFNSNYGNFKCLNGGVLGRPKSEDTNGVVKFQIVDSYQKPLTETMTSTNSIRKMFEKNGPTIAQGQPDNDGQASNKIGQNRVKNNSQVQIPKVRLGKPNANVQNNQGNHRTLIDKVELDIDKIRIPRASIQHQTVDKCDEIDKQKSHSGNNESSSSSSSSVASNNCNDNGKNNVDNDAIDGPIDTDHKLSDSVILVDNREGSILTLDCKNISKIDPNDANNELFYLPPVMVNDECPKKAKNKSAHGTDSNGDDNGNRNDNTNDDDGNNENSANNCNNNLDSLSQSSAESSTSSGCSSDRSSSPQSTTSPMINLENGCPSSSPPDSLDSSAAQDSYDSNNANQANHDSMNLVDEGKTESMMVKGQSSTDFANVLRSSENEMDKDGGGKRQDNNLDCSTIQWPKMVDGGELKTNGPPTAPAKKSSSTTTNGEEPAFGYSQQQQEDKTTKNDLSTTMMDNGKNIANENENLKQRPATMEDKRNQKLVQMALDLQRHRNNSNIINNNETSSSLSRSDSNQSSVNSRKSLQNSSESFRERLLREAFEESIFESTTKERKHWRRKNHKKQSKHSSFNVANSPGGSTLSEDSDANNESDSGEEQQQHKFFCENGSDSSKSNSDNSGDEDDGDGDEENSDKAANNHKVFGAKKPFSKIFKNMKNAVNPNKKYTKMMKVNLSKTSKFIVNTTQHFRNETSDMVKKFKNDKKSCDSSIFYPSSMMNTNGEENHGDRLHNDTDSDRQSNSDKKSKMMFKHQNDARMKSASIEPTLVKIKRLGSTKYFQTDKETARFTMSNEDLGVLHEEKPPCVPPRSNSKTNIYRQLPDDHVHQEQPPKAPVRKKKMIKRTSLTLSQLKADFEQNFKIMENASITKSLDSHLKVLEGSKSILGKDYRLQQCLVRSNNCEANLLTSSTFWVTCYDQDFRIHHYQGSPCRLLGAKWNCFLKISAFCDRLNQMPSDEHRKSLVDSIVLQLYTVLAQFETRTKNAKLEDAPLTVGQIIDAIVGVSFVNSGDRDTNGENHQRRIDDVLLLLPTKQMDMKDDDQPSTESDSWHTEQAFYLQVFLMRLTRLITTNNNNNYNGDEMVVSKKNSRSRPNHSESVSKRSNMFSSLNELRILATVDVFNILENVQSPTSVNNEETDSIRKRIECWFRERRNLKFIERFYEIDPVHNQLIFKPSSVLDYLQIDFVLNHDPEATFQLVHKDLMVDNY